MCTSMRVNMGLLALTCCAAVIVTGCGGTPLPDAEPLEVLQNNPEAIVRLYAAPLPMVGPLAEHTWFVVKAADSAEFRRWEVWLFDGGIHGYVWRDLFAPEEEPLTGFPKLLAETTGREAEDIITFLETRSGEYPAWNIYVLVPGPNCNTFTQWVLDQTGWNIQLPASAVGKSFPLPVQ